jgi:transposase
MAMGADETPSDGFWIETQSLVKPPGHPFYQRLNQILREHKFNEFVNERCRKFYAETGRPSIPPPVYFRMLMIGYFEGLDSERGIAWRSHDSLSLRQFLGYGLGENTPDHSSLSRIRQRIDLETHREIFTWVLQVLAKEDVLSGKTVGVDATVLEANAALRSIVRRDTGEKYQEFLTKLAQQSGIETPTREDLTRLDKNRPKKGSNNDWKNPHDPDAKITKMKDGRTHLGHKSEHAVDMDSGAVLAVTLQPGNLGDTSSVKETFFTAVDNLLAVTKDAEADAGLHSKWGDELVADKGYHSDAVLAEFSDWNVRTYISEPKRKRRRWEGRRAAQQALYANRSRIQGNRGLGLMRRRGELIERSFAHCYESGAMRRTHLRGHENILKRLLIHVGAFNLSLILRKLIGAGTPRELADGLKSAIFRLFGAIALCIAPQPKKRSIGSWFRRWCYFGQLGRCSA